MTTTHRRLTTSLDTNASFQVALDPVWDTQAIFRETLDAFAWPGSVRQLPVAANGAPVNPWATGLLITLLDHEVTFAVAEYEGSDELERFIRQRTNAAAGSFAEADFALAQADSFDPALLLQLKRGNLAYPDDGATLVLLVDALGAECSSAQRLYLAGPGVPEEYTLSVAGLSADVVQARNQAVAGYPCGVDLILIDSAGHIAALPRSTRITLNAEEGS